MEVLDNQEHFRQVARAQAESALDVEEMVDRYLKILLGQEAL
jgi:hypothetical protein